MRHFRFATLALCASLLALPALAKEKISKLTFTFADKTRTYYSFVPDSDGPLPLVILLHGSGRNGGVMADAWKGLASREHFILAAPDSSNPSVWDSNDDPPAFLHAVVEQSKTLHAIDGNRIYLFGHSAGAVYALLLALLDSEYFAATAVHAGALYPENYNLFAYAKRRMPIAIWVGNLDTFFSLDVVTATKKAFESNGFPVELTIIPNHTHNYDEVSGAVNSKAWNFLKQAQLPHSGVQSQP